MAQRLLRTVYTVYFFGWELELANISRDRRRRYVYSGHFDTYYVCAAVSDDLVGGVLSAVERTHEKTFMLLPGTSCTWEINLNLLVEPLSQEYHVLCVNYTGFDGSDLVFETQEAETERIEDYVIRSFGGRLDAVYGSSMGGSFASLLAQRKRIHINHVFIGSSDLDQASPFVARLETAFMGTLMKWMAKHPDKAMRKFSKVADAKGMSVNVEELKGTEHGDAYLQYLI